MTEGGRKGGREEEKKKGKRERGREEEREKEGKREEGRKVSKWQRGETWNAESGAWPAMYPVKGTPFNFFYSHFHLYSKLLKTQKENNNNTHTIKGVRRPRLT